MLPDRNKFNAASHHLRAAGEHALVHYVLNNRDSASNYYGELAIKSLKDAATALGYELVQRVTPAARDGGRMDMPEGEDA